MSTHKFKVRKLSAAIWMGLAMICHPLAHADVVNDGTMGGNPGSLLKGGAYQIDANKVGQFSGNGRNAFFSFSQFNVETARTAHYYCGSGCGATQNVISRITGNSPSSINGTVRSDIGGGDSHFYMLNPNGVVFGQNAKIDVPGTAHISTAQSLHFQGGRFDMNTSKAQVSTLNGDPTHFGFLQKGSSINLQGQSLGKLQASAETVNVKGALNVAKSLEIVGNKIVIAGKINSTQPNAPVTLRAEQSIQVDSGGEIYARGNGSSLSIGSGKTGSRFTQTNGTVSDQFRTANVNVQGSVHQADGGDLSVEAESIAVTGPSGHIQKSGTANLAVTATGADPSATDKALTVRDGGQIKGNNQGSMTVQATNVAGSILVDGATSAITGNNTENPAGLDDPARRGDLRVTAGQDVRVQGGRITGNNKGHMTVEATNGTVSVRRDAGNTQGGTIEKTAGAELFTVTGKKAVEVVGTGSTIRSTTDHTGAMRVGSEAAVDGLKTARVNVTGGGTIHKATAGDLDVEAGSILVDNGKIIKDGKDVVGNPLTGNLTVTAKTADVTVSNGGQITGANAGTMTVKATQGTVSVTGNGTQGGTIEKTAGAELFTVTGKKAVEVVGTGSTIRSTTDHTGAMRVGSEAAVDGLKTARVNVTGGGTIHKATAGDLDVEAGSILVDNGKIIKDGKDVVGNPLTGNLTVTATGADTATDKALTVSGGGQITGNNQGSMTVQATNAAGSILVDGSTSSILAGSGVKAFTVSGGLNLTNEGLITGNNAGTMTVQAQNGTLDNSGTITGNSTGAFTVQAVAGSLNNSGTITGTNRITGAMLVSAGSDLTNSGTIEGSNGGAMLVEAQAGTLTNTVTGTIAGKNTGDFTVRAVAGALGNQGTLSGANTGLMTVEAEAGSLSNSGSITAANTVTGFTVSANQNLTNSGTIQGNNGDVMTVQAQSGTLDNSGTITGNSTGAFTVQAVAGSLNNSGTITGTNRITGAMLVSAGSDLTNSGTIEGSNGGAMLVEAQAGTLTNTVTGTIAGKNTGDFTVRAVAGALENQGTLSGANTGLMTVEAEAGSLSNSGSITAANTVTGFTVSANQNLTNSGTIQGNNGDVMTVQAQSGTLDNSGTITGNSTGAFTVQAVAGSLNNSGTITGTNRIAGAMTVSAGGNLTNSGGISGANQGALLVTAGTDLTNNGGRVTGSNTDSMSVSAGNSLAINGGSITGNNGGLMEVKATNGSLTVNGGHILGNNLNGNALMVSAGQTLNLQGGGSIQKSNAGNLTLTATNLSVDGPGSLIQKAGAGDLSAAATQALTVSGGGGIVGNQTGQFTLTAGTDLNVTGANSRIVGNNGGNLTVTAANNLGVANGGAITGNNGGLMSVSAGNNLTVNGGKIEGNNGGDMAVGVGQQLTVHGGGSIQKSNAGNLTLTATNLSVDGPGSLIQKAGAGDLSAAATQALTVSGGGGIVGNQTGQFTLTAGTDLNVTGANSRIVGNNGGNLTVTAANNLGVANGGAITGNNGGDMSVSAVNSLTVNGGKIEGNNGNGMTVTGYQALTVQGGGTIQKSTAGNLSVQTPNLTVTGPGSLIQKTGDGNLTVDGWQSVMVSAGGGIAANNSGSMSVTSSRITVTGSGSNLTKSGTGDFSVIATGGDSSKDVKALNVLDGGRLVGDNDGKMTVEARQGTVQVGRKGDDNLSSIQKTGKGAFTLKAKTLKLWSDKFAGKANALIRLTQRGDAAIQVNNLTGEGNGKRLWAANARYPLIQANNRGDLRFTSLDANTLTIDPVGIWKNSQGNIQFTANRINLNDSDVRVNTKGGDGGNIVFNAASLNLNESAISNIGEGASAGANNIQFNTPVFTSTHSLIQTHTNPAGQGGNISITPADAAINYPNGRAEWALITDNYLNNAEYLMGEQAYQQGTTLRYNDLGLTTFAVSDQAKLATSFSMNATTNSLLGVTSAILAPTVRNIDLDSVMTNPCGKGGSSLSLTGQAGFGAEPSVLLPMPGAETSAPATAKPASGELGAEADEPGSSLRVASAVNPDHLDCNSTLEARR